MLKHKHKKHSVDRLKFLLSLSLSLSFSHSLTSLSFSNPLFNYRVSKISTSFCCTSFLRAENDRKSKPNPFPSLPSHSCSPSPHFPSVAEGFSATVFSRLLGSFSNAPSHSIFGDLGFLSSTSPHSPPMAGSSLCYCFSLSCLRLSSL
ncbi:hypothetical protein BKA57DRAFT_457688 [Linnemannia elongata]|nr:hypothetical protein BKA57DRAFT_457688 [Linnemannia elongata]